MRETEIRQMTVEALVDTGAMNLVMGEQTCKRLGLAIVQQSTARLAGGAEEACKVTEPVTICWKDRFSSCHALVLPSSEEILLGCIPLEDMDLKVNPGSGCLEGANGDMWVRYVR
jgi:clan AA aspartic protease